MIYPSLESAKKDLDWLLKNQEILQNKNIQINEYKKNIFEENLQNTNPSFIQKFYSELFEQLGFEKLKYKKELTSDMLPCIGLVPNIGLVYIYEQLNDGWYKIKTRENSEDSFVYKFENNSFFATLKTKRKNKKFSSAKLMFKTIALKQKKLLITIAFATFSINILSLATSLYSMQVYDRVVPTGALYTLISLSIGVFIAMFLELVLKLSKSTIQDYAIKKLDIEYSDEIFRRFLNIRCDSFPKNVGTLSSQLQGYNNVRAFISNAAVYLIVDLPFSLIFLFVIVIIGGFYMGLIPIVFFILSFIVGFLYKHKIVEAAKNSSQSSYKKMGLLVEAIENNENIKATGLGFQTLNTWNSLVKDCVDDDIIIKHYSEKSMFISQFLQQLSYVCIVAIGAYFVFEMGTLTMGSLIAMTILSGRILQPISQIPSHFAQWGKTKLAIEDLDNLYSLPSDSNDVERVLNPHLYERDFLCDDIKFSYENKQILQINHLKINQGEKVAIVGAIGSGKTTLLKILARLYKPSSGNILLNGIDMDMISNDLITNTISYLPQNTQLLSGTLRDNLALGMIGVKDEEIIEASKKTGLINLINSLPNGLDTEVPENGAGVSGGQKQLIALTRVLISNRNIVLLDEPTSSLDDKTELQIIKMFKENLINEQTLVLVTHKPVALEMVDRIIVLTPKGIILDGNKKDVLKQIYTPSLNKDKK